MGNTPNIRFKGFTDDWEQRKLGETLKYEQPGAYIVDSTDYDDSYETPVLTAGQSFILGYTNETNGIKNASPDNPVIIFDDFTTSSHFVDFPFKVKSSAMKLLTLKDESDDIYCINNILKNVDYVPTSHERHWISIFSEFDVTIPHSKDEQKKIGDYFRNLDHLITLHQRKCDETKKLKKFMLQKMFPKKDEKKPEIRFAGFTDDWEQRKFGTIINETRERTTTENEDTLLSCAIDGMFLNSELFSHFRGSSNIGYLKVKKNDLILSAQNLHLGNCNVNLRFEHGIISPAYKVYELIDSDPLFIQAWVKQDSTKDFFLKASTEGASVCRKNIVWEELYKQTLPIPKLEEQTKIGEYFSNLDNLITLHQRKCDELKEFKKYMLQNMFPQKG